MAGNPSHALAQVAHDPRILIPFSHEGDTDEMRVQDASAFVDEGEELSFWELMVRRCNPDAELAKLYSSAHPQPCSQATHRLCDHAAVPTSNAIVACQWCARSAIGAHVSCGP